MRNIQGAQTVANEASFLNPRIRHHDRSHPQHHDHEPDIGWIPVHLGRDIEGDPDRRGRDRNHAAGQDTEENGVQDVVDDRHERPADPAQVPVESQPGLHRYRRADECPGQHRQQVAYGQTEEDVPDAGAPVDEQHADDELGRGDMLTGERSREVARAEQPVSRNRLTIELV